jgi:hypothetical protein
VYQVLQQEQGEAATAAPVAAAAPGLVTWLVISEDTISCGMVR